MPKYFVLPVPAVETSNVAPNRGVRLISRKEARLILDRMAIAEEWQASFDARYLVYWDWLAWVNDDNMLTDLQQTVVLDTIRAEWLNNVVHMEDVQLHVQPDRVTWQGHIGFTQVETAPVYRSQIQRVFAEV